MFVREDRVVHARLSDGSEMVRYERAGKWFQEFPKSPEIKSKSMKIDEVVAIVAAETSKPGTVIYNLMGGGAFSSRLHKAYAQLRKDRQAKVGK